MSWEIFVSGTPAPQGSKRHVGGGRMVESSKAVGPWREAVRAETQRTVHGCPPIAGPVNVAVTFYVKRPAGHYGTGRNASTIKLSAPRRPSVKPDLDKLARAVLDGLTEGGAFGDDAQVVGLIAAKWYGTPRCRIFVTSTDVAEEPVL